MKEKHTCPIWVGYLLASPLRKLFQSPYKILSDYVKPGMTVMDIGCAMGFFSVPMAQMVGKNGKVYCIDIQQKMLDKLLKRAKQAGVKQEIEPTLVENNSLGLENKNNTIDFALLFAAMHEMSDQEEIVKDIYRLLKPNGKVLLSEPLNHVSDIDFTKIRILFQNNGFKVLEEPHIKRGMSLLLQKLV